MFGILKGRKKINMSNNVAITKDIVGRALLELGANGEHWTVGTSVVGKPANGPRPNTAKYCLTGAIERAAGVWKYSTKKGGWYRTNKSVDFTALDKFVKDATKKNPMPSTIKTLEDAATWGAKFGATKVFPDAVSYNDNSGDGFQGVRNVLYKFGQTLSK